MSKSLSRLLAAMTCAASLSVYAADATDSKRGIGMRAPSPASVDACKGLAEEAACAFTGRESKTVEGVCKLPPPQTETTTLACRPNNRGEHHGEHRGEHSGEHGAKIQNENDAENAAVKSAQ